jgi:cysteine desulfurase / selenocysteine lyase
MELNKIREDFNMLSTKLVYFDNAATTFKPQIVSNAICDYYLNETANIHRGDYDLSLSVSDKYEETRNKVAEFINSKVNEVVFTSGTTDSINRICFGFARKWLKSNDVILTTVADHASNLLPWFQLSKETGIGIEYIELSDEGAITIENFKKAMHGRVKIVAIAHITNVMGHIAPIKEIAAIAHDFGAIVVIDGAQSVPHIKQM